MDDLRFCPQGCYYFINNQAVGKVEYETYPRPLLGVVVEALIPCRVNPGNAQKSTEDEVGFFVGSSMKRAFGTLLAAGGMPILFDASTGTRLREASDDDMMRWKAA